MKMQRGDTTREQQKITNENAARQLECRVLSVYFARETIKKPSENPILYQDLIHASQPLTKQALHNDVRIPSALKNEDCPAEGSMKALSISHF